MPTFNYRYTHDNGNGEGTIDAKDADSAKKKLTETIVLPRDEKGKPLPLKNLEIEVARVK